MTITADCTPPVTSIDAGPEGPTNDPTPSFRFSATDASGGGFECSIDSAPFTGCASPLTSPPLEDGAHSFRVRAVDAVGNVDPAPPTRSFVVDTEPPDTAIDWGPSGAIRATATTFGFIGGARFECALDGTRFAPCSAPATVNDLVHGSHVFLSRAIDDAGNVDPTPASRAFSVDLRVSGVRLTAMRRQRTNRAVVATVEVASGEPGSVGVRASADLGSRTVHLRTARRRLDARGAVPLRLEARPPVRRAITRAGEVRIAVHATFRDRLGNREVRSRIVRVRG